MSTLFQEGLGSILDNYADVIEGGNAYNSGTSYPGIPGTHSAHEWHGTTITSTANSGNATSVTQAEITTAEVARKIIRDDAPPFFLVGVTQASGTGNVGAARKVTAHASGVLTVAAFPENIQSADTFTLAEGFRRVEDGPDPEDPDAGFPEGLDRSFTLDAMAGDREPFYGKGVEQYRTRLDLTIRFLNKSRRRNDAASLLNNLTRIRSALTHGAYRSSGVVALTAEGSQPEVTRREGQSTVVRDTYSLVYRITSTIT